MPGTLNSIPEDLLPATYERVMILPTDDLRAILPEDETSALLHQLCDLLMPDDGCSQIDYIRVSHGRARTHFELQLTTELPSPGCKGRIDAALRTCGFEPTFAV